MNAPLLFKAGSLEGLSPDGLYSDLDQNFISLDSASPVLAAFVPSLSTGAPRSLGYAPSDSPDSGDHIPPAVPHWTLRTRVIMSHLLLPQPVRGRALTLADFPSLETGGAKIFQGVLKLYHFISLFSIAILHWRCLVVCLYYFFYRYFCG